MNVSVNQGTLNDPSANNGIFAEGINDLGEIVGYYLDLEDNPHGYLSRNGTMVTLDHPAAAQGTLAESINNAGEIVGYYYDDADIAHGFLYRDGMFITLDEPAAIFGTFAESIDDAGNVVGFYYDADSQPRRFTRAMGFVEEPAAGGHAPARKARRARRPAGGLLDFAEPEPAPPCAAPPDRVAPAPVPVEDVAPEAPLRGYVDRVNSLVVEGWAQNPADPDTPVALEMLIDGRVVQQFLADRYRADLQAAGVGNGKHAFSVMLPPGLTADRRRTVILRRVADQRVLESTR